MGRAGRARGAVCRGTRRGAARRVCRCIPWAGALAFGWWFLATAALLFVRRATAGMLGANLRFGRAIPGRRVFLTALAVLVTTLLAGFPALAGARFWLPSLAAGSPAQRIMSSAA
ncbi:MAG: hypothetical protein GXP48_04110 [Acidobacteria bacterium]|nr:hypothetical protein [Acidobacteriota bacterium]